MPAAVPSDALTLSSFQSRPAPKVNSHSWKVDPSSGLTGGHDLWSVSLDDSGNVGFAIGSGGVVLRWDGRGWKADAAAMQVAKGADFHAVTVDASGKRALAIGAGGLVMSWNGTTWKHELAAEKLAIGRYLLSARFDNNGRTAWVVGQYGMALHWKGSKWTRAATPFSVPGFAEGGAPVDSFGMWSVWVCPNGVDAIATGNGNRILRWNGRNWKDDKQVATLRLGSDAFSGARSIAMSNDGRKGWMVGGETNLTWTGSKWQKSPTPAGDYLDLISVACDSTGTSAFAVGLKGTVSRWDGTQWILDRVGQSAAGGKDLYAVSLCGTGKIGFAVGRGGYILRWDGQTWKPDPAGQRASFGEFSSVAQAADGRSAFAVCFMGDPLRWDGSRWEADRSQRSRYMRLNVLWMAPGGDKAIGAGEEGIYRWNGSEWTAQPSGRSLHSLALASNGLFGFAGSIMGNVYRYDGSSWTEDREGTKEAAGRALYAMSISSDGKIGFAAGSDVFLRWDGSAWRRDSKLSNGNYNCICLNAKGDLGFATGLSPAGDVVSRWNGKAWRVDRQANKVFTDSGPYSIALSADGRTGIAVAFQGGGVLFWDGVKWTRDEIASQLAQGQELISVCLDPAGRTGWVLGWHGFLMRYEVTDAAKAPGR